MKMFKQIFAALALLVLVSGCSKSNYDKWLTGKTWNLGSFSKETKTVTTRVYASSGSVGSNYTNTHDVTETLAGGTDTRVTFDQNAPATGTTTSTTQTDISKNTTSVAFDKGGTYSWTATTQDISSQFSTSTTTGPIVNSTSSPSTSTSKDDWAWLEDGAIKDQLVLTNGGTVMIKLTKSSMTWTYNPSNTTTSTGHDGNGDYTDTQVETTTNTWSFN